MQVVLVDMEFPRNGKEKPRPYEAGRATESDLRVSEILDTEFRIGLLPSGFK